MRSYFPEFTAVSGICFGFAVMFILYQPKVLAAALVTGGVASALFAIREALAETAERIKR